MYPHNTPSYFVHKRGNLRAVLTDKGRIETGQALLCVGIGGSKVTNLAGGTHLNSISI